MKLIVLDRDGVINQDSDTYIKSPEEWIPIPGSLDAIGRLSHAGYRVIVTTNQSGIARELLDIETLNRIHQKMHHMVHEAGGIIEAVFFCPDLDDSNPWRKPNPGMLKAIGERLGIPMKNVPCVGDAMRDVIAARAVKARPILVKTGRGQQELNDGRDALDDVAVFEDLAAAADAILNASETQPSGTPSA